MARKYLQIVDVAYRATLEEQDDPIIWISHALKGAGADLDVLLKGNAVNYAVQAQDASGLQFGGKRQTQPPRLAHDLTTLAGKGVTVYVVKEDLGQRGLEQTDLIDGLKPISSDEVAGLMDRYDQVWYW
jgi:sulfur transfer complex TusBCD TusB component (DsrH family)